MSQDVLDIYNVKGRKVKEDERYVVKDNKFLKNLVLSSTRLKANSSTTGHQHKGQEEVYFFVSGTGNIQIDKNIIPIKPNTVVLIPDGAFHRVFNTHDIEDLYFVCVFDGKRYSVGEIDWSWSKK